MLKAVLQIFILKGLYLFCYANFFFKGRGYTTNLRIHNIVQYILKILEGRFFGTSVYMYMIQKLIYL